MAIMTTHNWAEFNEVSTTNTEKTNYYNFFVSICFASEESRECGVESSSLSLLLFAKVASQCSFQKGDTKYVDEVSLVSCVVDGSFVPFDSSFFLFFVGKSEMGHLGACQTASQSWRLGTCFGCAGDFFATGHWIHEYSISYSRVDVSISEASSDPAYKRDRTKWNRNYRVHGYGDKFTHTVSVRKFSQTVKSIRKLEHPTTPPHLHAAFVSSYKKKGLLSRSIIQHKTKKWIKEEEGNTFIPPKRDGNHPQ
jgi:hypothetical protein